MSTFLTDIYDRGMNKVAVAGPTTPAVPTSASVKTLDAEIKAPAKKTTPPEMPTAASEKAAMVITAMNAVRNSPGHIKKAAAKYLGQRMARK